MKMLRREPADNWQQGFHLGNGFMGQVVYGQPLNERVELSHITFFSGSVGEQDCSENGAEYFIKMREAASANNFSRLTELTEYFKGNRGNYGSNLPVGKLLISFQDIGKIHEYQRYLDIYEGIAGIKAVTSLGEIKREAFTSHEDMVFAYYLEDTSEEGMSFEASYTCDRHGFSCYTSKDLYCFKTQALENLHSDGKSGVSLAGKIKPVAEDGEINITENGISIKGCHKAVLFITMSTDFEAPEMDEEADWEILKGCNIDSYKEIKKRHIKDMQNFMKSQTLVLETGEEDNKYEFMYQYGRYLLLSSSREDSPLPAHLQGVWNDNVACRIGWTCDMHLDINTQMNYWLSELGNLSPCHKPVFRWMEERLVPKGRENAKKSYGLKGWAAELTSNCWGYASPYWDKSLSPCPTGGIWQASDYIEHFRYTQDDAFLKAAYPIIKEAVEFFLGYVFIEGENYSSGPSISPENAFMADGKKFYASNGCTYEILMIRELFRQYIEIVSVINADSSFEQDLELIRKVEMVLEKLMPYRILADGTIAEWSHDYPSADPQHRHTSHLLGLFPYGQITVEATPELAAAAKRTIAAKLNPAEGWEDTGWARSMLALYSARLKEGDEALFHLNSMLTNLLGANGMIMHPPTRGAAAFQDVYELDGNTGFSAAIAEMLLQSHNGVIQLLPALPNSWSKGRFKGGAARGGVLIDMEWENGCLITAAAVSKMDRGIKIQYKDSIKEYQLKAGERTALTQ